jgi:hypothetical protein
MYDESTVRVGVTRAGGCGRYECQAAREGGDDGKWTALGSEKRHDKFLSIGS